MLQMSWQFLTDDFGNVVYLGFVETQARAIFFQCVRSN